MGGSSAGLRSHDSMPSPPIPNRIHASRNTGSAWDRGLENAT